MSSVTTCLYNREQLQEKHLAAHTYLGMHVYVIQHTQTYINLTVFGVDFSNLSTLTAGTG